MPYFRTKPMKILLTLTFVILFLSCNRKTKTELDIVELEFSSAIKSHFSNNDFDTLQKTFEEILINNNFASSKDQIHLGYMNYIDDYIVTGGGRQFVKNDQLRAKLVVAIKSAGFLQETLEDDYKRLHEIVKPVYLRHRDFLEKTDNLSANIIKSIGKEEEAMVVLSLAAYLFLEKLNEEDYKNEFFKTLIIIEFFLPIEF